MTPRQQLVLIANATIVISFILGTFFNATTPQFIPTGMPIPNTTGCDLLSTFTRLCFPNLSIPTVGGTFLLNFDVLISFLTFGGTIFGLFILHREEPV